MTETAGGWTRLLVAASLLPGALAAWELSPRTLAERVHDSSLIVVARVAATHSRKASPIAGVGDAWDVTLRVTRTLKGKPPKDFRVTFVEAAVQDWPGFRPHHERVWLLKATSNPRLFAAPAFYESVLTLAEEPRVSALLQSSPTRPAPTVPAHTNRMVP
jgi:hypothetical protein